ncbi:hypothetical protein Droror1_Dr00014054 [Drosera rotundifolia]
MSRKLQCQNSGFNLEIFSNSSQSLSIIMSDPSSHHRNPSPAVDNPAVPISDANHSPSSTSNATASQVSAAEPLDRDPDDNRLHQPSSSSDALAKVVSGLIGGAIKDFDAKSDDMSRSQDVVLAAVDRLTRELDQLLEDAPVPFIMQHAAKISGVRKRVSSLNSLLKSIQRRLDCIDQMVMQQTDSFICLRCISKLVLFTDCTNKKSLYPTEVHCMI